MLSAVITPGSPKGPWNPCVPHAIVPLSSASLDVSAALVLATSAARPYLNDLKPSFDFVSPKSLTMSVVKSAIYTSLPLVLALNKHVQQAQEAEDEGRVAPDFDFTSHLKYFPEKVCSYVRMHVFMLCAGWADTLAMGFGSTLVICALRGLCSSLLTSAET